MYTLAFLVLAVAAGVGLTRLLLGSAPEPPSPVPSPSLNGDVARGPVGAAEEAEPLNTHHYGSEIGPRFVPGYTEAGPLAPWPWPRHVDDLSPYPVTELDSPAARRLRTWTPPKDPTPRSYIVGCPHCGAPRRPPLHHDHRPFVPGRTLLPRRPQEHVVTTFPNHVLILMLSYYADMKDSLDLSYWRRDNDQAVKPGLVAMWWTP